MLNLWRQNHTAVERVPAGGNMLYESMKKGRREEG